MVPREPEPQELERVTRHLLAGHVALLPTDTIYGLHALATNPEAIDRIATIKGRDEGKPFVVLGASLAQLEALGIAPSAGTREILTELWPAPLTAIVPLRAPIPASRGAATLAVRVPALTWLRQLVETTGPLVSTSANRSGEPPVTSPSALASDLQTAIHTILDCGPREGEPSAIVDFTGEPSRVIREGEKSFTQNLRKRLRNSL